MTDQWTPGPWKAVPWHREYDIEGPNGEEVGFANSSNGLDEPTMYPVLANATLMAAAPAQDAALNYVADMTYCGADAEWHFKEGYDPQIVLDALALARVPQPRPVSPGDTPNTDEIKYRCVNGHDRCNQMYPGPDCPYCEREDDNVFQQIHNSDKAWGERNGGGRDDA